MEKHALVYLLPRFLDPTNGEIRIDGKNLRWVTLDSLRAPDRHGLAAQPRLQRHGGRTTSAAAIRLTICSASSRRPSSPTRISSSTKLPQGLRNGDRRHWAIPLKLGEQFRIALARALLRDPAILVIEEPATPLDEDTKGLIDDTLQRVLPGRTVIFLPHRSVDDPQLRSGLSLLRGQARSVGRTPRTAGQQRTVPPPAIPGVQRVRRPCSRPAAAAKEEEVSESASEG